MAGAGLPIPSYRHDSTSSARYNPSPDLTQTSLSSLSSRGQVQYLKEHAAYKGAMGGGNDHGFPPSRNSNYSAQPLTSVHDLGHPGNTGNGSTLPTSMSTNLQLSGTPPLHLMSSKLTSNEGTVDGGGGVGLRGDVTGMPLLLQSQTQRLLPSPPLSLVASFQQQQHQQQFIQKQQQQQQHQPQQQQQQQYSRRE